MPATTITQIILFATADSANLKDLTSATEDGHTGLRNQAIGTRMNEEGVTYADPKVRSLVLGWDADNKSGALDLKKILPSDSKILRNIHVAFDVSPDPCFSAPVTEILICTIKPEQDLVAFGEITDISLREPATIVQPGCRGTAWGYTKEDPRVIVLLVGWDTVSHHKTFTKTEIFWKTTEPFLEGVVEWEMTYHDFSQ